MPLDPGRDWLAAGITGLQRQREWDAVASAEGEGTPGDEVEFVALADGTFVLESDGAGDPAPFAAALGDSIEAPYRALAVRRPECGRSVRWGSRWSSSIPTREATSSS